MFEHLITIFSQYGYIAVFAVLVMCGFGLPIPEDVTLVAGGVICALSKETDYILSIHYMIIITLCGVLFGDGIMFSLGRYLGPRVTRIPGLRHVITPQNYAKIQEKARHHGDKILFIARFLPGLRAPIFVISGISHRVSLIKFFVMDGSAALISVPFLVYLGYFFADDIDEVIDLVRRGEFLILGGLVVIIVGYFVIKWVKYINKKNS